MRRHRRDFEILSEMNLTNLLDTAFVLLIAFILVSPSMRHALNLQLPAVAQADYNPKSTDTLTIVIQKKGEFNAEEPILLDEKRYTIEELKQQIEMRKIGHPKLDIVIEADMNSTYNAVAKVLSMLKSLQIENVGLSTEPENLDTAKEKEKKK